MPSTRSVPWLDDETQEAVRRLLDLARTHLGTDIAWVSQFLGDQQVLRTTSGDVASMNVQEGASYPLAGSFCIRVQAGTLPAVIPDTRRNLVTRDLDVTHQLSIGAYVGAPVHDPTGQVTGMLCCLSRTADPTMDQHTPRFVALLADLISDVINGQDASAHRAQLAAAAQDAAALQPLFDAAELSMVYQPVVTLDDRAVVGFEALARFDVATFATPAHAFATAARAGRGPELEALAVSSALARVGELPPGTHLAVNLSADSMMSPVVQDLLLRHVSGVVAGGHSLGVEITEHVPVDDYTELIAATSRLRSAGITLSVDDAGAGYASFRHILQLQPDVIKIDIGIIRGIDTDLLRQALTRSLVAFGRDIGATMIAEGVETDAEHAALCGLGVQRGQGYLYGRPAPLPAPAPHVPTRIVDAGAAARAASRTRMARTARGLVT